MELFNHSLYELAKGVRNLILLTDDEKKIQRMRLRLEKEGVAFEIHPLDKNKANLFFGKEECVEMVKSFNCRRLNQLSREQDYILGIMLGYDILGQCNRYLNKK